MRTPAQIVDEALSLRPPGWVWPGPGSAFAGLFAGLAAGCAQFEADLEQMLQEIDPRTAVWLLADFERVLGPDPCGRDQGALTPAQRQALAYQRLTAAGGQSIGFFEALAAAAGYAIQIIEPQLTVYGKAVYGTDVYAPPPEQYRWIVVLPNHETGLECPITGLAPADTGVYFRYASAA